MKTIKYNHLIATLIIIFSLFFHNAGEAQVSNDDRFHYELYIGLVTPLINEDLVNTDEWVAKFISQTDVDNSASTLGAIDACGPIFRVDPGQSVVGPDTNDDDVIDGRANVTNPPSLDQNENNVGKKAIDINMRVFEEDTRGTGSGCSDGDINHDETAIALLTIDELTVDNFAAGQNFAGAIPLNTSGANTTVAYAWRYARGEFNTPLDFGALPFNLARTHLNSNRRKPVLSPSSTALGIHTEHLNYPNGKIGNSNSDAGEVYYKFSIDSRSIVSISTSQNTEDTFLQLFGSGVNPISELNNDLGTIELEAGDYTIVVDGYNGGSLFNLSVLREHLDTPANFSCTTPIFLTVDDANCSTTFYNSLGATQGTGACAPNTFAEDAVFFAFTATSSDMTINITGDPDFDPVFQVYQQTQSGCFGVEIVNCVNNNSTKGGTESFSSDAFIVGKRYNIRVYDAQDGPEGEQSFTICVSDPCIDGYTGTNALAGTQASPVEYITNQSIESTQVIGSSQSQISVLYSAGPMSNQYIELMPGFEVKENTIFIADLLGCDPH